MTRFFFFATLLCAQGALAQVQKLEAININDSAKKNYGKSNPFVLKTNKRSSQIIDQKELGQASYSDINRVMKKVPGATLQEEDGFGLRPNIGMRGTHPNRSKKISLLEDGVLIGPAPYSAPAAYYFPLANKIEGIEIYKGPDSTLFGPNTVGGAINMLTRPVPERQVTEATAEAGLINRYRLSVGGPINGRLGYLLDLHQLDSKGFKHLDSGKPTGFNKYDLNGKLQWESGDHKILGKFSYGTEKSYETYLGLTPSDLKADPYWRYGASQDDLMSWNRAQYHLEHQVNLIHGMKLETKGYYHDFNRTWTRLDSFKNNPLSINNILDNPIGTNSGYVDVLRGFKDSTSPFGDDQLIVAGNQRNFLSRGIVTSLSGRGKTASVNHQWQLSARFHKDQINRHHTAETMKMIGGQRVSTGDNTLSTLNKDQAEAITLQAQDEITLGDYVLGLSTRYENVSYGSIDKLTGQTSTNNVRLFIPSAKLYRQHTDNFGTYIGVNRGITLPTPNVSNQSIVEKSINYEGGWNYQGPFKWKGNFFFTDYKNLTGGCVADSSACASGGVDSNGGKAVIYGHESLVGVEPVWKKISFPMNFNYSMIVAKFMSDTTTSNEEWGFGKINKGDPLPYVPRQQYTFSPGIKWDKVSANANLTWMDKMYDQTVSSGQKVIPAYGVIDLMASYQYSNQGSVYMRFDNIMGNDYLVSYRPLGARPGKPRMAMIGIRQSF